VGLTVAELCRRHPHVGIDSNILVYLMEQVSPWERVVSELMSAVESRTCRATLSAIALGEVLGGPARHGELAQVERYASMIAEFPGLTISPVDLNLVVDAAVISGIRNMSLADAIHMASARAAGATAFVTNDRRVRGSAKLEVVYLDELEAGVA
jgi:predicted nucleic acid-binding protein